MALALLASFAAPVALTTSAGADTIADKRAKAKEIAQQIEENGARISMLDEDLLDARQRIADLEAQIADATALMGVAETDARRSQGDLEDRAAALYIAQGSAATLLPELQGDDFSESGARQMYLSAAAAHDNEMIDALKAARSELADQKVGLEAAKQQADAERARLDEAVTGLEAANRQQEQLLAQTQGELRELIAQEQQRQAAAAEAAARAEQERQAAQDAQNNDTQNNNDSNGSGNDNGGNGSGNGGGSSEGPPISVVAPNPRAQAAVDAALAQVGKPYRFATPGSWDVVDPPTFDCSGLTGWAWARAGFYLPHQSRAQFAMLPKVSRDDLLPGDLVFYGSPIHHVGMYVGNGQYVGAPYTGAFVRVSSIYRNGWAGAARVPG